ncbi:ABC transporter ATP-binding protein [Rhizobium laguerreae]|uniref:dipeptide ABC transporter ATP-binding protein n=1 Tax=Rhizobium laguerreae TaxID=1076926 RepID=UPI00143FA025|nr:ABC transporter ATP-binding protein [Rhizobium laguerreae]MBY3074945.1 ABC transporter ATP-binding protein [Rhizobium laguerreae]MBY3082312.1 ABC transporter ATP-binding protein [Rhizobium laguerreae]MBY3089101.1 ABC transporter ATP-binding protein [Rhizobium laguerreae]MBY3109331.1 ABC transporter ATP-binding protein [Rhizobium laguerreae]MBY3115110.1 ABC transporter ATP-binding protein [Rhizobium laguerreae]
MSGGETGKPPLLEIKDLCVSFGVFAAVKNVSFMLQRGEILGIVGESGSGKSVTCRALMRLLSAKARADGTVRLDGRDLLTLGEHELCAIRGRDIGMIFQNPASHLDPLRRIGPQVAAPMIRHLGIGKREGLQRAIKLLEDVGIHEPEKRARSYPHEFSGGMKQRAMIAAAIGCQPKLLIADEPTTALDVTVQARILELLKELNRKNGLAMILISHDLGVVADICSRVVVMRNGEVVEQGPIDDVINRPRHPYTRLLIESQPGRKSYGTASGPDRATPLLSIENLSVTFPAGQGLLSGFGTDNSFRAIDGIDLMINTGETVGIVGESGSGKSTLARSIIRLNTPSGGAIRLDGQDVGALGGEALTAFRRRVQMVFQNPYDSLNPRLTIAEAVAEPIWRHGIADRKTARKEADALLDMVELPSSLRDRKPQQLSGGQCQRVGLARALALKPQLLIADEITSALDVTTQAQILELLVRLQRERSLTLLYISHDLAVVSSLCQRVYVFKAGRIVEQGVAWQVLFTPQDPYTQALVGSLVRLPSARTIPPSQPVVIHAP